MSRTLREIGAPSGERNASKGNIFFYGALGSGRHRPVRSLDWKNGST